MFIFEFSAQNYPYTGGVVTICKSSIFDLFNQFFLLYETVVYSFSATEKRSEVKFCTRVSFPRCNGCAKFRSDGPSS